MKRWIKKSLRFAWFFVCIILLSWIIKGFILTVYVIPTQSMYPGLEVGDYVTVQKFPYVIRVPEFYPLTNIPFHYYSKEGYLKLKKKDIVAFYSLSESKSHPVTRMTLIKRITALPSDTVYVQDKSIVSKNNLLRNVPWEKHFVPQKNQTVYLTDSNFYDWE